MSKTQVSANAYFANLRFIIENHPFVIKSDLIKERLSQDEGYNQVSITLIRNYKLEVFEYYIESKGVIKYRYQLLDSKKRFVARWDNAPHHSEIKTNPDHYHTVTGVEEYDHKSLKAVLDQLDKFWT